VSIDEALLPGNDERLSAERAYELYWAELLGDEPRFTCVGAGCHAPLTCACLRKPEQTLLIRPYFRSHRLEDHAATCEVVHGAGEAKRLKGPDVFESERPAHHFDREASRPRALRQGDADVVGARLGAIAPAERTAKEPSRASALPQGHGSRAPSHYYRLSSLVQRFLEHRRDKDLAEAPVTIGGETTTYEALFRNVYRQKAADHLQTRAVWWGTASVRATKDGGYFLRFSRPFRHGDELLKPTITLTAKDIDAYPVRKLLRARLDKLIAEHEGYCVVFAWAKPWMPKDAEKPFVRFYMDNLDHIDVRSPEILEELKNTSRVTATD